MTTDIKRVALITGGNRGTAFEVCRQLGRLGCKVILTSLSADWLVDDSWVSK